MKFLHTTAAPHDLDLSKVRTSKQNEAESAVYGIALALAHAARNDSTLALV
jgi:hypothetical protein